MTLPPETQVWTTGTNLTGSLPNPADLRVFATQEAARADVADRIDELADEMLDEEMDLASVNYPDEATFEADSDRDSFAAKAQAENVRGNADLDYAQAFSVQVDNTTHQPPVFWAQPSTVGEYFGGDTDSPEYADLEGEIQDAQARQAVMPTDRDQWPVEDLAREWHELRSARVQQGLPTLSAPHATPVVRLTQ